MTAATAKRRTLSYGVVGLLLAAAPFLSAGSARADASLSFNASASAGNTPTLHLVIMSADKHTCRRT